MSKIVCRTQQGGLVFNFSVPHTTGGAPLINILFLQYQCSVKELSVYHSLELHLT